MSMYPGKAFSFPFYRNTTEDGRWIQVPCYQVPFLPAEVPPPPPKKILLLPQDLKKESSLQVGCAVRIYHLAKTPETRHSRSTLMEKVLPIYRRCICTWEGGRRNRKDRIEGTHPR